MKVYYFSDVNRAFTDIVLTYIGKGYRFSTNTPSVGDRAVDDFESNLGYNPETIRSFVELTDGKVLIRISLVNFSATRYSYGYDFKIVVGRGSPSILKKRGVRLDFGSNLDSLYRKDFTTIEIYPFYYLGVNRKGEIVYSTSLEEAKKAEANRTAYFELLKKIPGRFREVKLYLEDEKSRELARRYLIRKGIAKRPREYRIRRKSLSELKTYVIEYGRKEYILK